MSDSLLLLFKKEQPWANRSCRFLKNSDCERIALDFFLKKRCQWFAHDSSKSISKNEGFAWNNFYFLYVFDRFSMLFPLLMPKSKLLPWLFAPLLFFKERREWFTIIWEEIALLLTKNAWFAQKKRSEFPNPDKEAFCKLKKIFIFKVPVILWFFGITLNY